MMNARFIRQELCLILTLVLFIRGHQGFFVKHSSSGLCLQSASQYRLKGGSDWGPVYVAYFYNTCLHPDAQFRFFQPFSGDSVLFNIGKGGTFLARDKSDYRSKFHIYHAPPGRGTYTTFIFTNQFALKQTKAGALKLQVGYCPTPREPSDTSSGAIIPQNGDTVYQNTNCEKEEQKFIFGQVTKEGKNMTDAHCSPSQVMEVVMAEYGGFSDGKIFDYTNDADCSLPSANIVKSQCDGKISCNMSVNSSLFKNDPCPGKDKQLYMEYVCVDSLSTPITKASKVRLSELPNEGFIEIFDGSKWRKVDDKNWDKRKQTPLCQHLGYSDTKSNNTLKEISSGEIATGYLYCSGQQPSTQACSVYLYPSTLTNKATKIPYGKCTLCDEPLLQNSAKFPDTIFSASDSNGRRARLSNSGWCPKSSGTQYLQIDLQKDFFISHIATFGDKEQTKWATSYDLQYSRTSGKLGSSAKRTITSTHDAYGASVTALNIVYARFLKISVKNGNTVCIRVQLCGHVLLPDAVKQLTVSGETAITADISWTLPEYEGHVGITYFLISLNDSNPSTNVTRQSGNQHQLKNLKPYTNYKVTVQAGNAYGLGSITFKTFRTNQEAPDGPPLDVVFVSKSKFSLTISWKPPEKKFRNGIVNKYKVCYSTKGSGERCTNGVSTSSYSIKKLKSATKYFVRVSAGTIAGFGVYSKEYSNITNEGQLTPTQKTYFSLSLSLKKPETNIKSILIVVQSIKIPTKTSDAYQPNQLKPFSAGSSDPYVTAGFSYDNLPKTFVIGDGRSYTLGNTNYINQPLTGNTAYILFVRFIETEKMYYSTEWSNSIATNSEKAPSGPPLNVNVTTQSSSSLFISWKAPEVERQNGVITNFTVCLSHHKDEVCFKEYVTLSYELSVNNLSFSTKYFVRVLATTRAGSGNYSQSQEALTNGRPLSNPVYRTPNTLLFLSQIPKENVSYYEVIAVYMSQNTAPVKSPSSYSHLSPYGEAKKSSQSIPYIAAVFNINDGRFQVFTLGDGMNYSKPRAKGDTSEAEIYFNVPLKENGTYRVFQRFFRNKNDYYSSDWSPPAVTTTIQLNGETAATESCKEGSKTSLFVGIAVLLVLNAVLIIFIIYQNVCRARTQAANNDDIGIKVDNKAFSDDIYDEVKSPNNETPSTYEELNLKEMARDENTYQSLEKEATA